MKRAAASLTRGFDPGRLRLVLVAIAVALLIPTGVLIYRSYDQLKWEAFYQHRVMAEELATRVDVRIATLLAAEEARDYAQYSFFTLAGDPDAGFLQRSPLSQFPVEAAVPGLVGYFQVEADGTLNTPLLPPAGVDPASYGISTGEFGARLAVQQQIQRVLGANRLVRSTPKDAVVLGGRRLAAANAPRDGEADEAVRSEVALAKGAASVADLESDVAAAAPEQQAFDQLDEAYAQRRAAPEKKAGLGFVEDLKLDASYQNRLDADDAPAVSAPRQLVADSLRYKRREQTVLPEPAGSEERVAGLKEAVSVAGALAEAEAEPIAGKNKALIVNTFQSELDPFRFSVLDDGHLVLHRKVWRDGQRITQGALIARRPFIDALIQAPFQATTLSAMSDLIVALHGEVVRALHGPDATSQRGDYLTSTADLTGALLFRTRLSEPLGAFELLFTVTRLPTGPGGSVVAWVSVVLVLVLIGGFLALYRLGLGQIALNRQQQDFVSAVSHELKTPLTSIRMYGEMLQAGWAEEAKKQEYYDFICAESDRLSRLITNVLQLAQLTRNDPRFDLKPTAVAELLDLTESKIATQVAQAGFELAFSVDDSAREARVVADADCFSQVMINLVDNAIKFSRDAEVCLIEIGARLAGDDRVDFTVRDHGPGVADDQMKKIFRLFYRTESELTRETVGTGIGLALVHQLVLAMSGEVDVRNRDPGAEFRVTLERVA